MSYTPDAGDIVWTSFTPQAGREQAGHRPALVLSPKRYNGLTGLMVVCPSTTRIKGYAFEVPLSGEPPAVVLADAVRSLDWRARGVRFKAHATAQELADVRVRLHRLLSL